MKLSSYGILAMLLCIYAGKAEAKDTVYVRETQVPVLIERRDNALFYLRLHANESRTLNEVTLNLQATDTAAIAAVKLYYGGTEARQNRKLRFAPVNYLPNNIPGRTLQAHPSYSVLCAQTAPWTSSTVMLQCDYSLFPGINYFWISLEMRPERTTLQTKVNARLLSVKLDGHETPLEIVSPPDITHRMGVGVRHAGDDGSAAYRIPGLVTTNEGTLLAVYDIRHNSSVDLQEDIDIGLSRSTDGGRNWEKMRIPLTFKDNGGLPPAQKGVGDPCILVDTRTNTVWIAALWSYGFGNQRTWNSSHPGMSHEETGQLVLSKSTDDGQTWSPPVNITRQVKNPSWHLLLQGPGRGITMHDGTLVFPIQYLDSTRTPYASIMYSKDGGRTWKSHSPARSNTTEAQVAEITPGVLMLNMRDNRGGSRAVAITRDLGQTWDEHPSSRKALQEPVCMASLLHVPAHENALGRDLLFFSNPDTTRSRSHITIKTSLDGGMTWPATCQLMLDEDEGWGYSCLTLIDPETIGILYESSTAHMTFQAIKLRDLVKPAPNREIGYNNP